MKGQGYESVNKNEEAAKDEAAPPVDAVTVRIALVVSALSCFLSVCSIAFIVASIRFN